MSHIRLIRQAICNIIYFFFVTGSFLFNKRLYIEKRRAQILAVRRPRKYARNAEPALAAGEVLCAWAHNAPRFTAMDRLLLAHRNIMTPRAFTARAVFVSKYARNAEPSPSRLSEVLCAWAHNET